MQILGNLFNSFQTSLLSMGRIYRIVINSKFPKKIAKLNLFAIFCHIYFLVQFR